MFEHFLSWPCLYQLNVNDQIKIIHPLFSLLQSCPNHVFVSQMYKYEQYFGFISTNWGRLDQNDDQERNVCTLNSTQFFIAVFTLIVWPPAANPTHSRSWHHHWIRRSGDPSSQWRMISKAKMVEPCGTYGSKWFIISVYQSGLWSSWE